MNSPEALTKTRTVFFVSDGTGITAEMVGQSLLAQFPELTFREVRFPFVATVDKATDAARAIAAAHQRDGVRPIVFTTIVRRDVIDVLLQTDAHVIDLFGTFVGPLEQELDMASTCSVGRFHAVRDLMQYHRRIEAINFALAHDDGISRDGALAEADIILVGVSRSGKTPTSLYLAMTYSVKAANYPLIPEDFARKRLPEALRPYRAKLFGLSISPERLAQIRQERRPNSEYASLENCRREVEAAIELMRREGIPWVDSTNKSIEEIAALVLQHLEKIRKYQDL